MRGDRDRCPDHFGRGGPVNTVRAPRLGGPNTAGQAHVLNASAYFFVSAVSQDQIILRSWPKRIIGLKLFLARREVGPTGFSKATSVSGLKEILQRLEARRKRLGLQNRLLSDC